MLSRRWTVGFKLGVDLEAQLVSGLKAFLRRAPSQREIGRFSKYLFLLRQWNRVYALTGYRESAAILDRLFFDSLLFLPFIPPGTTYLLDLGSGAGIPGIPLKIIEPTYSLTLIEARRRKGSFLAAVVRELALENVRVLTGRAEALIKDFAFLDGGFDAVVTRASGPVDLIIPLALRFLRTGGTFVASGPPPPKPRVTPTKLGSWRVVNSPLSGLPRQFLVVEKKTLQ